MSETTLINGVTPNDNLVTAKRNNYNSKVTVVLGAQWGDEGKGKVVDMLAIDVDIVCRCQVCNLYFVLFFSFCKIYSFLSKYISNYKQVHMICI